MRMYIVFALFLVLPLAQGTFQPAQEGDIWREAALDSGYAAKFINNTLCVKNNKFSEACTASLRKGLQFLADRNQVTDLLAAEWKQRPAHLDFDKWLGLLDQAAPAHLKSILFGLMVNEYLSRFDAHAKILPVAALNRMFGDSSGEEVSPGFETEVTADGLYIRRVYPDSEAEALGLRAHDRIVYLNGEAVGAGLQAQQAARQLRFEAGREIQLTVLQNEELMPVSLKLYMRPVPVVISSLVESGGRKFAVMQIPVFRAGVCARAEVELQVLMETKPHGLIVDLRSNAGGRNDEARCFYRLLEKKPLSITRHYFASSMLPAELDLRPRKTPPRGENRDDFLARPSVFDQIPAAVLVSARSASVTELVAAALQDSQRAWIIGERTFGKGTFQLTEVLHFHTGLRLVHSVYQILRAGGVPVQLNGVTPNFEVPARFGAGALERRLLREEEMFPSAPKPASASVWTDARMKRRRVLEKCAARRAGGAVDDYQQAFAMAVLHCDSKN